MGRRSSIEQLPEEIQEAAHKAIRDGATVDDLVRVINEHGASVSRSAAGRYKKRAEAQMQQFREAQEIAKVWVGKLEEDPNSDVGRLLSEMLRTVAFQTIGQMGEAADDEGGGGQAGTPESIMLLSKAMKDLASADKLSADRELKIRQETAKAAAGAAEEVAQAQGLSPDATKQIKNKILGVAG